jgi:hypothetical protein
MFSVDDLGRLCLQPPTARYANLEAIKSALRAHAAENGYVIKVDSLTFKGASSIYYRVVLHPNSSNKTYNSAISSGINAHEDKVNQFDLLVAPETLPVSKYQVPLTIISTHPEDDLVRKDILSFS